MGQPNGNGNPMGIRLATGAFYGTRNGTGAGASGGTTGSTAFAMSAQRLNSIYGASNTVQPPAIGLIPQIKY